MRWKPERVENESALWIGGLSPRTPCPDLVPGRDARLRTVGATSNSHLDCRGIRGDSGGHPGLAHKPVSCAVRGQVRGGARDLSRGNDDTKRRSLRWVP